ncbi:MAG: response regulator transcription factor [Marinobacter sp.]|nr:response regulator transcription factor [Marinobacter sp.]
MHYVLTNKDFSASHWQESFDDVLVFKDEDTSNHTFEDARSVWLCTVIREWPKLLELLSASGKNVAVLATAPTSDEAKLALSLGANAYMSATASPDLIHKAKTTIAAGGYWIPNELLLKMLGQFNSVLSVKAPTSPDPRLNNLTPRELEVCREVAKGNSNKVIARHLHITERTVKEHLSRSFAKLGVKDRMQVMLLINGKLASATHDPQSGSQ